MSDNAISWSDHQKSREAFHALSENYPEVLDSVLEQWTEGSKERVILKFTSKTLILSANAEDDTIHVRCVRAGEETIKGCKRVNESPFWKKYVGTEFGGGWITVNQQGYCDGVLLGFGGIAPSILLNVMASSIGEKSLE
jgi:hypothetical protein